MISSQIRKSWQNIGGLSMKTPKPYLKINIMLFNKGIMPKKHAKISTPQEIQLASPRARQFP